jgi:hypothetical protein
MADVRQNFIVAALITNYHLALERTGRLRAAVVGHEYLVLIPFVSRLQYNLAVDHLSHFHSSFCLASFLEPRVVARETTPILEDFRKSLAVGRFPELRQKKLRKRWRHQMP